MSPRPHPSIPAPAPRAGRALRAVGLLAVAWCALALVPGWPGATAGPGLAWADDGDDGGSDDGGSSAAAASGDAAGADGGSDTDRGPREVAPMVSAGAFVADELLALDPSAAALQRVARWGATPVQTLRHGALGITVVRLRLPPGIDARTALQIANERDPGVFELHHRYDVAQGGAPASACDAPGCDAQRRLGWPGSRRCGRGQTVGMVDTAVATDAPALRGADVLQRSWSPPGAAQADRTHGTEIAGLLVGQGVGGLLPLARLRAAAVFQRLPSGLDRANAADLVAGLDWLLSQRVQVIGMSLAGPPNRVLEAAVRRTVQRGVPVVAAAGNGGRSAPPAHPAAVDGVLGATALSSDNRVYWRAGQGPAVDFALPGVGLPLPQPDGGVRARSGTSYAVPFLVALVSQSVAEGRASVPDWIGGERIATIDLGAPGRDDTFGWGLPRLALSC